ncbi:holo-ACP synthase [Vagococcus zengguangii]|uniref:Holo-[acyl-carrier-protein] synthase n=1 Tax=Vagococcus zengguangii TaxID=2571750 RepID=A0A4D7CRK7_9ENTE|nr:holo-ACP synthase [Vagococcus zengguangii]QCI86699.1 holo-ACP synthase [Vagococcus zengguangii]TLG78435.1 holo-ACP synthase [Vagococcus zengguangii]
MSIFGIGVDVVDIPRIKQIVETNPKFIQRVLTDNEYEQFMTRGAKRQIEYFAGRFACKEAFSKALGTGIGPVDFFKSIEVLNEESGRPVVTQSPFDGDVHVSISHSEAVAIAYMVLEK